MEPFEVENKYGLPAKPTSSTQVPYSLEYLDEEARKKSLLPKVGMRSDEAYIPYKPVDVSYLWNGSKPVNTVESDVKDKIAFGKPSGSVDGSKLIPKSLRAEQVGKAAIFAGTALGELAFSECHSNYSNAGSRYASRSSQPEDKRNR